MGPALWRPRTAARRQSSGPVLFQFLFLIRIVLLSAPGRPGARHREKAGSGQCRHGELATAFPEDLRRIDTHRKGDPDPFAAVVISPDGQAPECPRAADEAIQANQA